MAHYRNLFDAGKYLGSWHLPKGKDSVVVIESVTGGVLEKGKVKTKKPIVKMQGKTLLLALNKTNAKTIAKLYGTDPADWHGKSISLYVGRTRDPEDGSQCDCIRIRAQKPGDEQHANSGHIDETKTEPERANDAA